MTNETQTVKKSGPLKGRAWHEARAKGKRTGVKTAHDDSIHASRVEDERQAEQIHEFADEPWVNPVSLPEIKARPGMVQRWIRVAIRAEADPVNTARKFREGWVPRKVDTVPKNVPVPRIEGGKYAGCIGVEGMILCEMPTERNDARNKYFHDKNIRQTDAVNQRLAEETQHHSTAFGPVKKEQTSKFVREVQVAADE